MDISHSHILATSPHEYFQSRYYVILAHLSTYFSESVLIDLGTHTGESAAALSYNKSNIGFFSQYILCVSALIKNCS